MMFIGVYFQRHIIHNIYIHLNIYRISSGPPSHSCHLRLPQDATTGFIQTLLTHFCFSTNLPPFLTLSRQNTQASQLASLQPEHLVQALKLCLLLAEQNICNFLAFKSSLLTPRNPHPLAVLPTLETAFFNSDSSICSTRKAS